MPKIFRRADGKASPRNPGLGLMVDCPCGHTIPEARTGRRDDCRMTDWLGNLAQAKRRVRLTAQIMEIGQRIRRHAACTVAPARRRRELRAMV